MPHDIIMPVLGMSQDSGVLVAWLKEPGEAVNADDPLFEVETDKSVMEVNASVSGYLVARLAAAGDDVPTGETIGIIGKEPVDNPIDRAYQAGEASSTQVADAPSATSQREQASSAASEQKSSESAKSEQEPSAFKDTKASTVDHSKAASFAINTRPASAASTTNGRILASPKLKRLAAQAGYSLDSLRQAGYPEPYHAKDFEHLEQLALARQQQSALTATALPRRLQAQVPVEALEHFQRWAAQHAGIHQSTQILAGFLGSSYGLPCTVKVENTRRTVHWQTHNRLSATTETDQEADIILRDLRHTRIVDASQGIDTLPVITLTAQSSALQITLECSASQLTAQQAQTLIQNFADRVAEPLQHLM